QQYVAMEFSEFPRVVSSKVDEKQSTWLLGRGGLCQRDMIAIGMLDGTPAIKMQAFWRSPPLTPQVVIAILWPFADCVVQFDIGVATVSVDVKHKEFHEATSVHQYVSEREATAPIGSNRH